ncbi:MAG: COP9 signalosome complex subunit 8 [Trebouxia sp. A1-2]|nr:MAG: COP9 signalosome complex subunit 8 [Trebouxia sp. A1-2]
MSASLLQVVEQLLASGQYGDVAPQLDAIELQDTQLKAAFATLQHLWNKNYQGFWPLLTTTQWSEVTLPLVHAIAAKQRQDAVRLVSYAYSSIQPDRLASLTGTNPQEALQLAQSEGWQMNGDVIMVKREVQPDTHKESQDHLQHLTEFVVQLEV